MKVPLARTVWEVGLPDWVAIWEVLVMTTTLWMGWVRALCMIGWRRWRLEGSGWRGLLGWVAGGVRALVTGWRGGNASLEVQRHRLNGCLACPLFDARFRTCGSMDQVVETRFGWEPLGCGCFMPMKVGFAGSRCWLEERGAVGGWSDLSSGGQRVTLRHEANGTNSGSGGALGEDGRGFH